MFLGIDLGTTMVKVVLMGEDLELIAMSEAPLTVQSPQPLWSEQDPEAMWRAVDHAILALRQRCADQFNAVKAIGLAGQMHGGIFLDGNEQVLRPAILWNDGRAYAQCVQMMQEVPEWVHLSGNLVMPGFTAPKVRWVRDNEPALFARTRKILLPKDYLRLRLTGSFYTDMSDAAGTSWLNVGERRWERRLIEATGIGEEMLPEVVEGCTATGSLRAALASHWGLPSRCEVIAGGGDNAASALSVGAVAQGRGFISLGTSGVYFVALDSYRSNPEEAVHSYCHCLPQLWHQMSVHLNGTSCLDWAAKLFGCSNLAALIAEAETAADLQRPLLFLPYLNGERTPYNDPHARGLLSGLSVRSTRADVVHAVLAGVALAFALGQEAIARSACIPQEICLMGGGGKSRYWAELLASALGCPILLLDDPSRGAALGAARLAWFGRHRHENPQTVFALGPAVERIHPVPHLQDFLASQKEAFARLYGAVYGKK
jgi:xylulokinase